MDNTYYNICKPYHITAQANDFAGNSGLGRYVFLCGCAERAKRIGLGFQDYIIRQHPRGHDLYLGKIAFADCLIDVASISTGMGCPSTDNILTELYAMGASRFLRVGTAGSLQPHIIKTGNIVIASAAVRDESTSKNYLISDFPAVASIEMINAAIKASEITQQQTYTHVGIIHTKDSFYAREVGCSFLSENKNYMNQIKRAGVLASEMESSHIFILGTIFNSHFSQAFTVNKRVLYGSILGIVGDDLNPISEETAAQSAVDRAILLAHETFHQLYLCEMSTNKRYFGGEQ